MIEMMKPRIEAGRKFLKPRNVIVPFHIEALGVLARTKTFAWNTPLYAF